MKKKKQTFRMIKKIERFAMIYTGIYHGKHRFDLQTDQCDGCSYDFVATLFEIYVALGKGYDYLVVIDYMEDLSFVDIGDAVVYHKKNTWEKKPPRARRKNEMLFCYLFDKYFVGFDDGLPKDPEYFLDTSYIWTKNAKAEWMYQIFQSRDWPPHMRMYLFKPQGVFPDLQQTMEKVQQKAFLCEFDIDIVSHFITESGADAMVFSKEFLIHEIRSIVKQYGWEFVLYDTTEKSLGLQ